MIETFGDLVRFKREQKGFSLNGLAKQADLDVAYISKIEKNQTKQPSYLSVAKVAKALDITNEELATVFNVEVMKSDNYKINDEDIEIKNILSSMNDIIIKNINSVSDDNLEITIRVLETLKGISRINRKKRNYIIMLGTVDKVDIIVNSHIYDGTVKDFIEGVYDKTVAIVVEGSILNVSEERFTNIFDVIENAKDNEYIDETEVVEFQEYIKQHNI